jgi:hypothetical protein
LCGPSWRAYLNAGWQFSGSLLSIGVVGAYFWPIAVMLIANAVGRVGRILARRLSDPLSVCCGGEDCSCLFWLPSSLCSLWRWLCPHSPGYPETGGEALMLASLGTLLIHTRCTDCGSLAQILRTSEGGYFIAAHTERGAHHAHDPVRLCSGSGRPLPVPGLTKIQITFCLREIVSPPILACEQVADLFRVVGHGDRDDPECVEHKGKRLDRLQSPEYRQGAYPKHWVTYYGTI